MEAAGRGVPVGCTPQAGPLSPPLNTGEEETSESRGAWKSR